MRRARRKMDFKLHLKVLAACVLVFGSGQLAAAGRSLLQDAPTGVIMCDVAIVGGGPGGQHTLQQASSFVEKCFAQPGWPLLRRLGLPALL